MPLVSRSLSALVLAAAASFAAVPSDSWPELPGERVRHDFAIEMPKGYVGGLMIMMKCDDGKVRGSLVNEFGISLLDFSFDEKKGKVKLESVMKALDKWYIRRVLKNDLKHSLQAMQRGDTVYYDTRHKMRFIFSPATTAPSMAAPDNESENDTQE